MKPMGQGKLAEALASYQNSFAIFERLAKVDPGNTFWQRDLAATNYKVATLFARQDEVAKALDAFLAGRAIIGQLKEQSPDNAMLADDLAAFEGEIAKLRARAAEPAEVQPEQATR